VIVAGTLLIAVLKLRGERLPGPRAWPSLALLGVLLLGFGNGAVVWAEQTVAEWADGRARRHVAVLDGPYPTR